MKKCQNCDNELRESYAYCPFCGQNQIEGNSLRGLFNQFLNDYFTFDSKIWRTVKPLIVKPGFLTMAYLEGKRKRYVPPLRLFIFSSIIFFLVLSVFNTHSADLASISEEEARLNRYFESWLPKLFFVLLPIFAFLLRMFFKKKRRTWLPHFLAAFHFHAAIFAAGTFYVLLSTLFRAFDLLVVNQVLIGLFLLYLFYYLYQSCKSIYQAKVVSTMLKEIGLLLIYLFVLVSLSLLLLLLSYNS